MTNPLKTAIAKLQNGEIIGIPTETVYGLAVDARNPKAVQALRELKGRDANKPFQIMVRSLQDAETLVKIDDRARALAKAFLPGPLSLVLPKKNGEGTLAIRIPGHALILSLLEQFGKPLAATSLNPSGKPPARTAEEAKSIYPQLLILEGTCDLGVASTVVDLTHEEIRILREGNITLSQILAAL